MGPDTLNTTGSLHGAREIVLIEDDATDRLLIREMLENGHAVGLSLTECKDAASGLAAIGPETLCVLLDNLLPDALGIDLLPQLRSQRPDLAIVVLTGSGDEMTSADAFKRGATDYLPKHKMSPGVLRSTIISSIDKVALAETIRRKNERLLLLEELTDAAEDLLFVADCADDTILLANAATRRALGRTDEDTQSAPSPVANLFKAGYASWSALRGLLARRSPVRFETSVWAGGYVGRPVEISAKIVARGGKTYVIGIARDIVEQRRLQADLLRFAALDPQTELPTLPAFSQHLQRWATEHPRAGDTWMLVGIQVPLVAQASGDGSGGALVHARVRVARIVAEFAAVHGGLSGVSGQQFLAAVPLAGNAPDGSSTAEDLAHSLNEEIRGYSIDQAFIVADLRRAPVGIGVRLGGLEDLARVESFEQVEALATDSMLAGGEPQWSKARIPGS